MGKYPNTVKSFLLHYTDKINTFVRFHESYSTRQSTNYKRDKTKYHFTSKFTRKAPSRVRDRGGVVSQWENCIREINIPEHLVLSPLERTFPRINHLTATWTRTLTALRYWWCFCKALARSLLSVRKFGIYSCGFISTTHNWVF